MRSLLILPIFAVIAGCCQPTKPDENVVQHDLIAKKIPSELLVIPAPVQSPDLNGTQKDVALWIIEVEKRTRTIENQLKQIKEYNKE